MRRIVAATLCASQLLLPLALHAATGTDTATFAVRLVITETCDIHTTPPTEVNFGTRARTAGAVSVTAAGTVTVNCSSGTVYTIGLNGGNNAGATPAPGQRRMLGTLSGLVPYDLYQDATHATFWGNAVGSWLTATGTGSNQTYQVYGRLTNLNFAADTYADTVTATVTY